MNRKTILHVLDHSVPQQSGYASRSDAILSSLAAADVPVMAMTGPKHGPSEASCFDHGAVRYWRTPFPEALETGGVKGQLQTIRYTRRYLKERLREEDIGLLHAHSPCLNGLAAVGLGVPVVYEMRSSWEDAAVSVGTTTEGSARYRLSRALETWVARRADAVTVICEGLKAELITRGIPADRITVVPNALPESMFVDPPAEDVEAARTRYGLEGRRVIGFFGSFFEWEGVGELVQAMSVVKDAVPDAALLLAGGGRQESTLREMAETMGLGGQVAFAGRVPAGEMSALYGVAHLMAFPRRSERLTEMVTPLKPLESMARSVPVLASDVGGHRELIRDGVTGFLYPTADTGALARRIIALLCGEEETAAVAAAAREWVKEERRWSAVCRRYLPVYDGLLTDRSRYRVTT